jgi:predicted house-cleaning noncanonical NTP pyrophosphatase (MazG superfamily)
MKDTKLNETFNIQDSETVSDIVSVDVEVTSVEKPEEEVPQKNSNDIKKDYEYTRANLYSLIEKGQEAINGVLELAQESEMPRAYEVVGQLIKSVSDTTDKLMDLQKKLKDVEEEKVSRGPTNVTNALFVGSTAELSKLLKNGLDVENK